MMHITIAEPELLSRREAAKTLNLACSTLARMAREGRGPSYCRSGDVRGRVWYRRADLAAWLESRKQSPGACRDGSR
jgi:predicted DNA-binding transcriptional regulator AlpA